MRKTPFSANHLSLVADFDCGPESWHMEVAEWIKLSLGGGGALDAIEDAGAHVWLYGPNIGDSHGYGSLATKPELFTVKGKLHRMPVQVIPYLGIRAAFKGQGLG